jgi:hypothetical protein
MMENRMKEREVEDHQLKCPHFSSESDEMIISQQENE